MHQYYKTNSALGHNQYAYLLKLSDDKYLTCNSPDGSFYEIGAIITDLEYMYFEKVQKEEFLRNSHLHRDLIEYLTGGKNA